MNICPLPERKIEQIIDEYVWDGLYDAIRHIDPEEEWTTDDLIELGIVINRILRERNDG
ncbi:hypothetical protein LCGC14_2525480 [marine sediment metagenome]|uniref:Uncharacterized protein n=1 Tax=marine sediment metagenome TaxID=412755 RepID=A0A0F9D6N7_9ZZZZ